MLCPAMIDESVALSYGGQSADAVVLRRGKRKFTNSPLDHLATSN
jgi:hypothetical protein